MQVEVVSDVVLINLNEKFVPFKITKPLNPT
jgi:hypothetical protein